MKSKDSLPRSQEPVTCPHPVTHKSSPACPFYSFKTYFNIILPPTPVFSKEFFRKVAPLKPYAKFILRTGYPPPHPCPIRCPQFDRSNSTVHEVRLIKLLTVQHFPLYFPRLSTEHLPQHSRHSNSQAILFL